MSDDPKTTTRRRASPDEPTLVPCPCCDGEGLVTTLRRRYLLDTYPELRAVREKPAGWPGP